MKNNIIIIGNKYNDLNNQNLDKFLHLIYIKKILYLSILYLKV